MASVNPTRKQAHFLRIRDQETPPIVVRERREGGRGRVRKAKGGEQHQERKRARYTVICGNRDRIIQRFGVEGRRMVRVV